MLGTKRNRIRLARVVGVLIGCVLAATGLLHIAVGNSSYRNYWGGVVFAPFGVFLGISLIYLAIARPDSLIAPFSGGGKRARR